MELWHQHYNHLNLVSLNELVKNNLVNGISDLQNSQVNSMLCEPCLLGWSTRLPFNVKGYRAKRPLELIDSDVCGPIKVGTFDGYNYFVSFIDDYTHYYDLFNKTKVKNKTSIPAKKSTEISIIRNVPIEISNKKIFTILQSHKKIMCLQISLKNKNCKRL